MTASEADLILDHQGRPPMAVVAWRATTAVSSSCATRCPMRWCGCAWCPRRGSYWHADVVEVIEPSPDRVDSLCTIAGRDGAGCCDLAFADPAAARAPQGGGGRQSTGATRWPRMVRGGRRSRRSAGQTGWRTRVRLDVSDAGRAGFHRYHSAELAEDLNCAQLPDGMLDGLDAIGLPSIQTKSLPFWLWPLNHPLFPGT